MRILGISLFKSKKLVFALHEAFMFLALRMLGSTWLMNRRLPISNNEKVWTKVVVNKIII